MYHYFDYFRQKTYVIALLYPARTHRMGNVKILIDVSRTYSLLIKSNQITYFFMPQHRDLNLTFDDNCDKLITQ